MVNPDYADLLVKAWMSDPCGGTGFRPAQRLPCSRMLLPEWEKAHCSH